VPGGDSLLEIAVEDAGSAGQDERLRLLHDTIRRLDELDRALVVLYLDGNPHDRIAGILGLSETNVGTRIARIKQRLRRDSARTV
jgi:DNA-directed RNA polymerase specialized sigma24 family protein